jgi:hypothetical protein
MLNILPRRRYAAYLWRYFLASWSCLTEVDLIAGTNNEAIANGADRDVVAEASVAVRSNEVE